MKTKSRLAESLVEAGDYVPKVGDIVKYKSSFLHSAGWYTGVPKNGKVVAVQPFSGKPWPVVQWSDGREPGLINPGNIMLSGKPDYSGM